ncbi:hypothetical protein [Aliarcobacter cryaerophilus]|uniref:hypothetical protein n=1 Tax=Aliarcobacter cryaerophilus TaxID=28198 RepID=UPI0021B162BD|nr:hypothetical protein [Aliarcobacter cryaerophilus]MCT7445520.1 hypothetical protein [Aliarcobacter cryaerophilus]MCT7480416.1 hypothetical protein [Aliarcobacter cryaerophilus]
MIELSKIRIEIISKNIVPVNIDNPVLTYNQDKNRKSDRLLVKVYYDDIEIGVGIILDFYKKFEIIEDFGEPQTKVISFEHKGNIKFTNTYLGNMIYRIKNFKNPKIDEEEREKYIQEITAVFNTYLPFLEEKAPNFKLSYIPSSSKIPDDICSNLSNLSKKEIIKIIDKNPNDTIDSKSITTFKDSLTHSNTKYIFDEEKIEQNKKSQFLIIDDVLGNGSSMFSILKKLYDTTKMVNYFFIVVKDVKR